MTIKRALLCILLCISVALPARADVGASVLILNGVTTTVSSATQDVSKVSAVRVQVWSSAGASATILLRCRSSATAPWFTVATITDPTTTGEYWSIPLTMQFQAQVSAYVSGTIFVNLETHAISK